MTGPSDLPLAGKAVLIVEDEAFIAIAMEKYLVEAGAARVDCAASLNAARSIVRNDRFDVAILDVLLPDGMAHDLARDLLDGDTPVVFHSGHAEDGLVADFPTSLFCKKPSAPPTVIGILVRAMRGR